MMYVPFSRSLNSAPFALVKTVSPTFLYFLVESATPPNIALSPCIPSSPSL